MTALAPDFTRYLSDDQREFIEASFQRNRAQFGDARMDPTPAPTGGGFQYDPSSGSSSGNQFPTSSSSDFSSLLGLPVPGMERSHPGLPVPPAHGPGIRAGAGGDYGNAPTTSPVSFGAALNRLLQQGVNNPQATLQLQEQLIKAGYLNPDDTSFVPGHVSAGDATTYAYANLLQDAVTTKTSYSHILHSRIDDPRNTTGQRFWQLFQKQQATAATGGVTTKTYTSTATDFTSAPDAAAIAQSQYEDLLGRRPSPEEAQAFYGALHAYEAAHPSRTTATTQYDPTTGQSTVRDSTTEDGITASGAAQLAQNDALTHHGKEVAMTQGDLITQLLASMLGGG